MPNNLLILKRKLDATAEKELGGKFETSEIKVSTADGLLGTSKCITYQVFVRPI